MSKFDEIFEERYLDPRYPDEGTYLHPLEYSIIRNMTYEKHLTEEGKILLDFIKFHLFKGN